jgi:uncharacterized membrane protein
MKYIYLILNWFFGVFFMLVGLLSLVESPLGGFCMIAIAVLLLPPVRNFVYLKTNKTLPVKARAISVFVLLIAFNVFVGQSQDKKAQEQELAAQQAQEKKALKTENLHCKLKSVSAEEYKKNLTLYQQLVSLHPTNEEYKSKVSFYSQKIKEEKEEKEKQQIALATEKLLAELKSIPSSEYEKNRDLYKQLSRLHPSNEKYRKKFFSYSRKVVERKKRKKRIEKQFSAWDGSHRNFARTIKEAMHDPDSYEHVKTVYWDKGDHLIVQTTYRGKNVYGAIVKNSVRAKIDFDGQIIEIIQ